MILTNNEMIPTGEQAVRVTPGEHIFGIRLQRGAHDKQRVYVINEGEALTFGPTGDSLVADFLRIERLTAQQFIWDEPTQLWWVNPPWLQELSKLLPEKPHL